MRTIGVNIRRCLCLYSRCRLDIQFKRTAALKLTLQQHACEVNNTDSLCPRRQTSSFLTTKSSLRSYEEYYQRDRMAQFHPSLGVIYWAYVLTLVIRFGFTPYIYTSMLTYTKAAHSRHWVAYLPLPPLILSKRYNRNPLCRD